MKSDIPVQQRESNMTLGDSRKHALSPFGWQGLAERHLLDDRFVVSASQICQFVW